VAKARRWPPPIPIDGGAAGVKLEGFPNAIILSFQKGVAIMPGRNSPNAAREVDGRYARLRKPRKPPTARFLIAQWVKAQVVRLQAKGMTFERIAAELTAAGNGRGTTITDDRSASANGIGRPQFWPGYSITAMGCHKAWKAALSSQVSLTVDELRSVDNQRLEQLFMAAYPGVLRGDSQAINTALRVLHHKARLNGYSAPEKVEHEVDGAFEMPPGAVEFEQILDALSPEKQTQLVELLKEAKAASETQ